MAISLHKLCLVFIWVFVFFFPSPCLSLPHRFIFNRCRSHESKALLRFKAALNDSQGDLSLWVNGTDCCTQWRGISCDNEIKCVFSVEVGQPSSFQGGISESLCQLRFLTSLTISGVRTAGTTIPPCLGNLSYIESLDIFQNSFSGMIPHFVCLLTRLTVLNLSVNSFSGMIPASLCLLTRLKVLDLSFNKFNGRIPSCLGNLASLTELHLTGNDLSGSIPASLGSLSLLREYDLSYNQPSGIIPESSGNLSLLERLDISSNQLSGSIPPLIAQLPFLTELYVDDNRFNETISSFSLPPSLVDPGLSLNHYQSVSETFFHMLTSLDYLSLSDCVLNISTTWVPPWISTQFSLQQLKLTNASGVGVIPTWLCETSPLLYRLNLSGNHSWYKMAVGLSYGVAFGGMFLLILTRINWRTYFNKVDEILMYFFSWMKNLTL